MESVPIKRYSTSRNVWIFLCFIHIRVWRYPCLNMITQTRYFPKLMIYTKNIHNRNMCEFMDILYVWWSLLMGLKGAENLLSCGHKSDRRDLCGPGWEPPTLISHRDFTDVCIVYKYTHCMYKSCRAVWVQFCCQGSLFKAAERACLRSLYLHPYISIVKIKGIFRRR